MSKLWDRQGRQVQPRRICRQYHRRKVPCLGSRGVWSAQSRDALVWAKRKFTISPTFDFNVKIIIILLYEGWGVVPFLDYFYLLKSKSSVWKYGKFVKYWIKIFRLFKINSLWPKISYLDFESRSDAIGQFVDHTASLKKKKYSVPTWKALHVCIWISVIVCFFFVKVWRNSKYFRNLKDVVFGNGKKKRVKKNWILCNIFLIKTIWNH